MTNVYPQKLSTDTKSLWESPEITLNTGRHLTWSIRFTCSSRARLRGSSNRAMNLVGELCLLLGLISINVQPVHAASNADHFKLYAHSRIVNYTQFQCFIHLIDKENRSWNPKAKNGSHFGIGQMKNEKYKNLDGYTQIDWTLRYITKRYGSPCKAWTFFKAHGYH